MPWVKGQSGNPPAGKAMFQMMGVFAEFERAMIAERVRAELARARSEGRRLGRPPIALALEKRIREALATPGRPGVRVIAKRFGVNPGTVQILAAEGRRQTGMASDNSADFGGSQFVRVEHVHVNHWGMQRRRRRKTPLCLRAQLASRRSPEDGLQARCKPPFSLVIVFIS
jgi:hypothetical protein